MQSAGCDDKGRKFHPELLDEEIRCGIGMGASIALLKPCASLTYRSIVLSSAAKELEFCVHSMSASQAGYATRATSAVNSIKRLTREKAWPREQGVGVDTAYDEWDVAAILRRACLRAEGGKERA